MLKKCLIGGAIFLVALIYFSRIVSSTVHVHRTLNAPVEKVWQVWTTPEMIKNWWGPKDYTAPVIQSDFKVGGVFVYSMRSAKGDTFWNTGKYTEIVPNQKIVQTLSFADQNGKALPGAEANVPGVWPDEVLLTVEFKDVGGKTEVTLVEDGVPGIMKMLAKLGWLQQMDKMDALLKQ